MQRALSQQITRLACYMSAPGSWLVHRIARRAASCIEQQYKTLKDSGPNHFKTHEGVTFIKLKAKI